MNGLATENTNQIHNVNLYKTIYISIGFMLLYVAFSTTQNMISQIYYQLGYDQLGNYALFALYLTQAANNLFAPKIVQRFPVKWVLCLSALGYLPFMIVGILPRQCYEDMQANPNYESNLCSKHTIYGLILASAIVNGYCASLIWVCQGTYIGILSSSKPEKTGVYFGIFCSIFATSFLIGSVIGTFLLGYTTQKTFFIIMSVIGAVACLMLFFIPSPFQEYQITQMKEAKKIAQDAKESQAIAPQETFMQTIQRYAQILKTDQIVPLMVLMGLSGTISAFYAGFMYMLIQNTLAQDYTNPDSIKDVNQKTCYVYICQGIFEIISGYAGGYLAQRFNIYKLVVVSTLFVQTAFVFALICTYTYDYSIAFLCSGFIGFGDNLLNCVLSEIITKDYHGKSEIYALKSCVMSLVFAALLLINVLVQHEAKYSFILAIFIYQIFATFASANLGPQKPLELNEEKQISRIPSEDKNLDNDNELQVLHQQQRDQLITTKQMSD
ncbi:hypothetical protein ABPG74_021560 [Tetrahymena malaccensis]